MPENGPSDSVTVGYKKWIFIAIFFFGFGGVLGVVTPVDVASLVTDDFAGLKELGGMVVPFRLTTAIFIFCNNVSVLLLSFALSPIIWLVPVLALTVNGWLIAFVSVVVIEEKSLGFLLVGLLPHGIFEIPAFILGQAAALSLGTIVILSLFQKRRRGQFLPGLKWNLRYLGVACILLLPAAIIETYVTPLLLT